MWAAYRDLERICLKCLEKHRTIATRRLRPWPTTCALAGAPAARGAARRRGQARLALVPASAGTRGTSRGRLSSRRAALIIGSDGFFDRLCPPAGRPGADRAGPALWRAMQERES